MAVGKSAAAQKADEESVGRTLQRMVSAPLKRTGGASRVAIAAIKIDDGIPIPAPNAGPHGFPFDKLEVGQSFFVPRTGPRHSFSSVPRYNKMLAPKVFTSRKWTEPDGTEGFRVWRVE